ncbi:hypothetical protein F8C76_02025 [Flagellimonas olearia]|uniref:Methylamine utilisation protein MauE domain-containing protein n=1 Tax=Flagellimonas olearia TaxID=552546 RepID=A0A6I1DYF1_9FLAO|nr:MauE/DoxX family redox-associated membrane protein [Allomuricauda olearia]KAB7530308.1 hypothetical protein F8C76_02025 [Allomuricauda olearia]
MKGSKKVKVWFPYAISMLYAILFIYAATSKLWDFQQFKIQLGQSPVLTAYAAWIAWLVPITEYALAFLLLMDSTRYRAHYATLGLMAMFTTYILLVLNFSAYVPCSCGGVLEDLGWTEHIIFNLFFIGLSIMAILQSAPNKTLKATLL